MSLTYVKGDLFAANERAIAHGCNCHGYMGAGVAKIVQDLFPKAFEIYRNECRENRFYPGVALPVESHVDEMDHRIGDVTLIYNLATQNAPGRNAQIEYVEMALMNMKNHMDFVGNKRIAMPKIGAGIGGLNWDEVESTIEMVFFAMYPDRYDVVVYEL